MRLLGVLAFVAVAVPTTTSAQGVCPYIKKAEAVGVVVDQGAGKLAVANWRDFGTAVPVLTFAMKTVGRGDTVSGFLTDAGVMPDKYNLGVTKTLNPDIGSLDRLEIGEIVRIPVVEDSLGITSRRLDGYKTWPKLAQKWNNDYVASGAFASFFSAAELAAKYGEQSGWRDLTEAADAFSISSARAQPSNPFFALEQNVAAGQTSAFLRELMTTDDALISDPKSGAFAMVALAALDMTVARSAGRADLSVRTLSPANEELRGLRLYRVSEVNFRANCLDENKEEFDKRSSPAAALVPIAKWWIWAEDENQRKSTPRPVAVSGARVELDYTVEWTGD